MSLSILALIGYLIGSIPFGYIVGALHNIDLRKVGSGSTGGTNVFRALGIKWAALSGLLDLAKGLVFMVFLAFFTSLDTETRFYLAIFPILGHIYPVWLKFKGGKGVSVAFGSLTFLLGIPFSMVSVVIWVVSLKVIKIMSLVNLVLFFILPIYVFVVTQSVSQTMASVGIGLIIWWAHRENIQRLLTHTEKKLSI
ncbi:glycerol-3-phosphate 1-O-acyltransferase PlsY [Candidatus Woesebacteria bacterium]|nr:glycerol-3-phosphate 1-O-acyltransferase PlsY [Candidatus Woesebacteria bacterium]